MSNLAARRALLPSSPDVVRAVHALGQADRVREQVPIRTQHVIHGGQYHRTICIPAGVRLVGALIRVPTTLTVCGHVLLTAGDGDQIELRGYHVLPASPGRKQAYLALADTWLTMAFATSAKTVAEAEVEFTAEADQLFSREGENETIITGE